MNKTDNDLAAILERRKRINTGRESAPCREADPTDAGVKCQNRALIGGKKFNPFTAFPDLSRKQIKDYETTFKSYDKGRKGYLALEDVKKLLENVGRPIPHLQLKKQVNEISQKELDGNFNTEVHPANTLSFYGFLELCQRTEDTRDETLCEVTNGVSQLLKEKEVEVHEIGVGGAKNFFAAKIALQAKGSEAEKEIRAEQEARKRKEEEKKQAKADFKNKLKMFQ